MGNAPASPQEADQPRDDDNLYGIEWKWPCKELHGRLHSHYEFKGELARTIRSVVIKAKDRKTGQLVALKVLLKSRASPRDILNCRREASLLASLNHPNIVKLLAGFESPKKLVLVLELCNGGEILDAMDDGAMNERTAASALLQVCSAIQYMHSNSIVHRDLKPANLLYSTNTPGALCKVADFGLARWMPTDGASTPCGTAHYVAPEVIGIKGFKRPPYSYAVDMWSLGIVAYALLCGRVPFLEANQEDLFKAIRSARPDYAGAEWDLISDSAKEFVSGLLIADPSQRFTARQAMRHRFLLGDSDASRLLSPPSMARLSAVNDLAPKPLSLGAMMDAAKADRPHVPPLFRASTIEFSQAIGAVIDAGIREQTARPAFMSRTETKPRMIKPLTLADSPMWQRRSEAKSSLSSSGSYAKPPTAVSRAIRFDDDSSDLTDESRESPLVTDVKLNGGAVCQFRSAGPDDAEIIHRFISELAAYEKEPDAVEATPARLRSQLESNPPPFHCLIALQEGEPVGMALYFFNYSTWTGKPGLYVEDLFVTPHARQQGIGSALLSRLANEAVVKGCPRMEWIVINWNAGAIKLYESLGATPMKEWTVMRLDGDALRALSMK